MSFSYSLENFFSVVPSCVWDEYDCMTHTHTLTRTHKRTAYIPGRANYKDFYIKRRTSELVYTMYEIKTRVHSQPLDESLDFNTHAQFSLFFSFLRIPLSFPCSLLLSSSFYFSLIHHLPLVRKQKQNQQLGNLGDVSFLWYFFLNRVVVLNACMRRHAIICNEMVAYQIH